MLGDRGLRGVPAVAAGAFGLAPTPPPAAAAAPRKPRSPSTLRRLLDLAERDVEELTVRRDELQSQLVDGAGDHRRLADLSTDLAAVQERLTAAEERWLTLADELGA